MNMNFRDARPVAIEVAKLILKGDVIAFRDPREGEEAVVHITTKEIAELHLKVLTNMEVLHYLEGMDIQTVAKFCQWDSDVITEAHHQLQGEQA